MKKKLTMLAALAFAVLGVCMVNADTGADLTASGTTNSVSEFKTAIAAVESGGTYDGQGVTIELTDGYATVGCNYHTSDGLQVYVFGEQSSGRSGSITIKNVVFSFTGSVTSGSVTCKFGQIYVYSAADIAFENCIFDNVGVSFDGVKDTRDASGNTGTYLESVTSTFKNCTFENFAEVPIKYVFNTVVQDCNFTGVKRAVFVSPNSNTSTPVNTVTITGNSFGTQTKSDGIIKFYNMPTDSGSSVTISDNTIYSDYWNTSGAAFIQTDFNVAETTYSAYDYGTPVFTISGNSGVTSDNLNASSNKKTLSLSESTTYVASVVSSDATTTNYYATLSAAVSVATSGDTVTLLANIDLGTTGLVIEEGKNLTLNIGTYNITGAVNGKLITNNGTLTINGTTGCIYNTDVSAQGHDALCNYGTLGVNGGWFGDSNNDKTDANACNRGAAIRNLGTGVATIAGGHFTACDNWTNGGYAYALINGTGEDSPRMTITGADVYGKNNGNIAGNSGTVNVSGGTFDISGNQSYYSVYSYSANMYVTGGTFTKSGNSNGQFCVEVDSDNADNPGTIALSGGSYSTNPASTYLASGLAAQYDSSTGYYTIATAVAQIGSTGYATLADAVAAVPTTGEETTITMVANYSFSENAGVTIAATQNVILDLNGYVITQTQPDAATGYLITNNGALTLMDSTDSEKNGTGTGSMTCTATYPVETNSPPYANNLISNKGTLTIESGLYQNNTAGSAAYVVDNQSGSANATLIVNGGMLSIANSVGPDAVRLCAGSTTYTNSVTVTGGVISGRDGGIWIQQPTHNTSGIAILTISGGTISGYNAGAVTMWDATKEFSLDEFSNTIVTITGGEFSSEYVAWNVESYIYAKWPISLHPFRGNTNCTENAVTTNSCESVVNVSGGIWDKELDSQFLADGCSVLANTDSATKATYPYTVGIKEVEVDTASVETTVVDASGNATTVEGDVATAVAATNEVVNTTIANNTAAASKTGTGVKTIVTEETTDEQTGDTTTQVKSAIVTALQDVAVDKGIAEATAEEKITTSSDVDSYLNIALQTNIIAVVDSTPKLKTLVFDVEPRATVTVVTSETVDETTTYTTNVVEAVIANDQITEAITFRLPLTDDFTVSALVTHTGDSDRVVPVQGSSGQKFVELTFTHFSEVTATPTDQVTETISSSTELGIIRYASIEGTLDNLYTNGTEVAIGVPWLSSTNSSTSVTVAELISTGLTDGDQLSVWDKSTKKYNVWTWSASAGEWQTVLDADAASYKQAASASAYETTVERGQAVWYKRNDTTKVFALIGRPETNCTTTVVSGSSSSPAYNLMSNPFPDAIELANVEGSDGDQIVLIPDGEFITYKSDGWYRSSWESFTVPWDTETTYYKEVTTKLTTLVIEAGKSFWYISKGGAPSIVWKNIKTDTIND